MKMYFMSHTYNSYGSWTCYSILADFLCDGIPNFGDALKEITVEIYYPNVGKPKKTLEGLFESHQAFRDTLPKVTFLRKKKTASIHVASTDSGTMFEKLSLTRFKARYANVLEWLSLLKKRLKKTDKFDFNAFLEYCKSREQEMPKTLAGLRELEEQYDQQDEDLSEWDKDDVDWDEFHPDAKTLLDDPFYWSGISDFSPHGNDTGHDVFRWYQEWHRKSKKGNPVTFFNGLIEGWEYELTTDDSDEQYYIDQTAIAIAFAEIKIRGVCRTSVADLARQAIARRRTAALEATDWPHRDERLLTLEMMEKKINETEPPV